MTRQLWYTLFVLFAGWCESMAQDFYESSGPKAKRMRIGGHIGGQANISSFENAQLWDSRFRVNPYVAFQAGITIQEPISPRFDLNVGLSFVQLGLATSYVMNYTPGGRYAAKSTGRSSYGLLTIPVSIHYAFRVRPQSKKYLLFGTNIYCNLEERGGLSQSKSTLRDLKTGDVITIGGDKVIINQWIPALTVGLGLEQQLSRRSTLTLNVTGCVGLKEITNTTLSVSIVNSSTLVKPIQFTGNVINKGSYIGISVGYLYSWR